MVPKHSTELSMVKWISIVVLAVLLSGCTQPAPAASPTSVPPQPTSAPPAPAKPTVATAQAQPTVAAKPVAEPTTAPKPAAQPTVAAASKPATSAVDWDKVLADAKQEGKLVIAHSSLESNGRILEAFKEKYPSIEIERNGMAASVFGPRAVSEQRQGLYAFDLLILTGFNTAERVLGPADALGDIRPYLQDMPDDVKDDSKWAGGFMMMRNDKSPDSLVTDINQGYRVYINRATVPEAQLSSADQLIDPKFKGKIGIYRPAQSSAGSQALATLLASKGEDYVRKILFDQGSVAVDNQRQVTEWLVQGRYPIAIGVSEDSLEEFRAQGIADQVESLKDPATVSTAAMGLTLLKNAPHPNAVKVFLRWFLSKEGQDAYVERGAPNSVSRRLDAVVKYPDAKPDFARLGDYKVMLGTPSGDAFLDKVLEIANEQH
jgi:iron(III) transport system substrate-binding protein